MTIASILVNSIGIIAILGVAFLIFFLINKLDEAKQLRTSLDKLKRAFEESEEQAKLIVKTDLTLNKTQEELDKKVTGLYTLQKISRMISTTFDENEIFRRIDGSVISDLGFEKSIIFIFDSFHNLNCKMGCEYTKPEIEKAQTALLKEPIFQPVTKQGRVLSSLNTAKHVHERVTQLFDVNYFVMAPIMTQDGIAGFIFVGNKGSYSVLTEGDEELVAILASQMGQALENARLFDQVFHSHQELENKVKLRTKELAEALEEVRRISKMKSDFVSAVSHELRTPLTSIKGYASILMSGKLGEVNEAIKDRLEKVNKHSDNLVTLINNLLDISRIESGRVEMKFEFHSLPQIIETVADLLAPQLKDKKIELNIDLAKDLKPVFADASQIERVFINLTNNIIILVVKWLTYTHVQKGLGTHGRYLFQKKRLMNCI